MERYGVMCGNTIILYGIDSNWQLNSVEKVSIVMI